ncbi:MAG: hypothetical protein LBI85_08835 [Spirochaetaceae bacterium]|nr:hypothetical protein [Spirochaetaceae bacterium]
MVFLFLGAVFFAYSGENPGGAELSFMENIQTDFLWSSSWNYGKNFDNRLNLLFSFPLSSEPGKRSDALSLRFQVLDRRPDVFWQEGGGLPPVSAGIYHRATGSRLLYGQLEEWGLPARIRNPWIRSLPLFEYHSPSLADLKNDVAANPNNAAYLYLGSPGLDFSGFGTWNVFVTALVRDDHQDSSPRSPDLGGGIQGSFSNRRVFRMEGFYTDQRLEATRPSSWFSAAPPLPGRDFRLGALSLYYASPFFGIASDGAFSETFAYGRGAYGNLGIRFSGRAWKLSLAADAAGGRYVGRDGKIPGSAFRFGGTFERRGGAAFFSSAATLRARGIGEGISKSAINVRWRFPQGKNAPLVRLSGFSLNLKRDNDVLDSSPRPRDSAAFSAGFRMGNISAELGGGVNWEASLEALPWPDFSRIGEAPAWEGNGKISAKIQYLTLEARAVCTADYGAAPYWERYFSAVFKRGPYRLRAALSWTGKNAEPGFTLSWRFNL